MILYSLNGAYPKPLPHRIILSNGSTRTDQTTFTPEEIADAGYVAVPDPPSAGKYEKLSWLGTEWKLTETRTLEIAKFLKLEELAGIRRFEETNFSFNGINIYLSELTQARINAALAGFAYNPNEIIKWEVSRGIFVEFDKTTLENLAVAAWSHVKNCYVVVEHITTIVNNCQTITEIDAINLELEWSNKFSL